MSIVFSPAALSIYFSKAFFCFLEQDELYFGISTFSTSLVFLLLLLLLSFLLFIYSWKFANTMHISLTDNPPYCKHYRYQKIVSEGTHPGTYILSVMATDADEEPNAKLRYYLSGVGAEHFLIEKTAGKLYAIFT